MDITIYQLLDDPGLGHCARLVRLIKRENSQKRFSIILVPNITQLLNYLRVHHIHNIIEYDVFMKPIELIELVDKKFKFKKIKEWVIDSKKNCSKLLLLLKKREVFSTLIDNNTDSRLLANKNIYPTPLFKKNDLNWGGYMGTIESGWEALGNFSLVRHNQNKSKKKNNQILISFGGEDPNELTLQVMESLSHIKKGIKMLLVIGPLFKHKKKIESLNMKMGHRFITIENCYDLTDFIINSDCLVTSIGNTVIEALALDTTCVVISNYPHEGIDERRLNEFKNVTALGYYKRLAKNNNLLLDAVKTYVEN